jgi:hypothetical protein
MIFERSDKLKNDRSFDLAYEEFQYYKLDSKSNEHPAPTRHTQVVYQGVNPFFGRDRFDKLNPVASALDIQHVHFKQDDVIWTDSDGEQLAQWSCTSDSYLIYSYFQHSSEKYYYAIEFFVDAAHDLYEENIERFIQMAAAYKNSVVQRDSAID